MKNTVHMHINDCEQEFSPVIEASIFQSKSHREAQKASSRPQRHAAADSSSFHLRDHDYYKTPSALSDHDYFVRPPPGFENYQSGRPKRNTKVPAKFIDYDLT